MKYDVCIAGAGIVGLAHAYWAAKHGLSVIVVEKNPFSMGASVRNFGLFWEIGQEQELSGFVKESKKIWKEFFTDTKTWCGKSGSLGLAYHADELELLHEYTALYPNKSHQILSRKEVIKQFPYVNREQLIGALQSTNEITFNSREVIPELQAWLNKKYKVHFLFNTTVIADDLPVIYTNRNKIHAKRLIISTGADFELLYPMLHKEAGIVKCKLQMLKSAPNANVNLPALYGATSFVHYASFANCRSLNSVRERIKKLHPEYLTYGINLLIAQNNHHEILLGDSHEYNEVPDPFNKEIIDELILKGIKNLIPSVELMVAERWYGVYSKLADKKYLALKPQKNTLIVNAMGGGGMTLSFGIAKKMIHDFV